MSFVQYGNYAHAAGECIVVIEKHPRFNELGEAVSLVHRWQIQGLLQVSDPTKMTAALQALEAAYTIQGQNLGLFNDDGSATAHGVISAQTLTGVKITDGVRYPQGGGAEYSTFRSYAIAAEWETLGTNGLLAFHERLQFTGNCGARWGYLQTLGGIPPQQQLCEATPQKIVQSGQAIGLYSYPPVPAPLFPAGLEHHDQRVIEYESPKRSGPYGSPAWSEYAVRWQYTFETTLYKTGVPNRAIN
jgi:hypothetical protein